MEKENKIFNFKDCFKTDISNSFFDTPSTPRLSENAMWLLSQRYFIDKYDSTISKTRKENSFEELAKRVARIVTSSETLNVDGRKEESLEWLRTLEKNIMFDILSRRFLFNSPCLFSAGAGLTREPEYADIIYKSVDDMTFADYKKLLTDKKKNQQLFACFVISVPDDIEGIFESVKNAGIISKYGGGVGGNFGHLREFGAGINGGIGGKSSGPVSFMETWNTMGSVVVQGGSRRSALMGMLFDNHPDIYKFIDAKTEEGKLPYFNISVAISDALMEAEKNDRSFDLISRLKNKDGSEPARTTVQGKELFGRICESAWKRGDPGVFFIDTAQQDNILKMSDDWKIEATNPCLTGDTLIAVADGRGSVSIKELADTDKDVPVYTEDNKGNVVIRTMRHPRLTGKNMPIVKVNLDNGEFIKCTPNHKFHLLNGEIKEAKDLCNGNSLKILTREEVTLHDIIEKSNNRNSADYIFIRNSYSKNNKFEHRLICENYYGKESCKNKIVHHIDYNSKNNDIDNLRLMSKEEHHILHGKDMMGDGNPMRRATYEWSDEKWDSYRKNMSKAVSGEGNGKYNKELSDDDLLLMGKELAEKLGRRISRRDFFRYIKEKTNGKITQGISDFRLQRMGLNSEKEFIDKIMSMAILPLGLDSSLPIGTQDKILREYKLAIESGYIPVVLNNRVLVSKICEQCGLEMLKSWKSREIAHCSSVCSHNTEEYKIKSSAINRTLGNEKTREIKNKQIEIYNNLKFLLKREPSKKEFISSCKAENITYGFNRNENQFRYLKELREEASYHNHKVVSVEKCGFEDVYNGTVDEFHTFFCGGFKELNNINKLKTVFAKVFNCGEQALPDYSSCNLGSVNTEVFTTNGGFNWAEFRQQVCRSIYYLDLVIDATSYPLKKIEERTKMIRPVGLGLMGLADSAIMQNMPYSSQGFGVFCKRLIEVMATDALCTSVEIVETMGKEPFAEHNLVKDLFLKFKNEAEGQATLFTDGVLFTDKWFDSLSREEYDRLIDKMEESDTVPFTLLNTLRALNRNFENYSSFPVKTILKSIVNGKMRNSRRLSIAPTGSISMLLDASSGIEPNFAWSWTRHVTKTDGTGTEPREFWHKLVPLAKREELKNSTFLASDEVFKTAHDIKPEEHVEVMGIFAKVVDSGISKTVNIPNSATVEDVKNTYKMCYGLNCKGITIYRDGSRSFQPIESQQKSKEPEKTPVSAPVVVIKEVDNEPTTVIQQAPQISKHSDRVKARPGIVFGKTMKETTPWGGLYVTLNFDDMEPFEIFISIGKSGSELKAMTEALSRVISIGLRSGCKLEDFIDTLKGLSGKEYWMLDINDDRVVRSLPDAIAMMIEKLLEKKSSMIAVVEPNSTKSLTSTTSKALKHGDGMICPDCKAPMELVSGCAYCFSCGYSPCK